MYTGTQYANYKMLFILYCVCPIILYTQNRPGRVEFKNIIKHLYTVTAPL